VRQTNRLKSAPLVYLLSSSMAVVSGCDKGGAGYSLQGVSQSFSQSVATFSTKKIDILWVIDNSGSMQTSQANLSTNFTAFIKQFQTLGVDYHMAVTTTDAYLADPSFNNGLSAYNATNAKFRDGFTGTYGLGHSGVFVMTPANLTNSIFQMNMSQGTAGSGDERAFSSVISALNDTTNIASGFRRPDAFLSIIMLSDEDDFSGTASFYDHFVSSTSPTYVGDHNYTVAAPELQTVSYYVGLLDTYVGNHTNYSVSAMYADTAACIATLNATAPNPARIIAQRMPQMVAATNGVAGSLCGDFATNLTNITTSVVEAASVFTLSTVPNVSTISVTVNGVAVPNDPTNGWTYSATANTISFRGTAVPATGAAISVNFTPATVTNH